MKLKHVLAIALIGGALMNINPSVSNAEYITLLEETHYEKYVLDTDSLYYPDKDHKFNQFNCIVWFYDAPDAKGIAYTLRYKFEKNKWLMAEKDGDKLVWDELEENSVASNALRVVLPYIGHTVTSKKK